MKHKTTLKGFHENTKRRLNARVGSGQGKSRLHLSQLGKLHFEIIESRIADGHLVGMQKVLTNGEKEHRKRILDVSETLLMQLRRSRQVSA